MSMGTVADAFTPEVEGSIQASEIQAKEISSVFFKWGEIRRGNCVMEDGSQLTLYSDGLGKFNATTYTNHTHSGDCWHHLMFVTDSRDQFLFWAGFFDGPDHMNDGNPPPRYSWERQFRFDPAKFDAASTGKAFVKVADC